MQIIVADNPQQLGSQAAAQAAAIIRASIDARGQARIIVATGTSQFETLSHLIATQQIDWTKVHAFHLDEYVGLPADHPASFVGYLQQRFASQVPLASMTFLDGTEDPQAVIERASSRLRQSPIDVALIGIGENGHLAFNDPPALFKTPAAYHVVELDEACRRQQVGEGWFGALAEVPTKAISMTVPEILKATTIICSVPDERKATAVAAAVQGPIVPEMPASALQTHSDVRLFLDLAAASQLTPAQR